MLYAMRNCFFFFFFFELKSSNSISQLWHFVELLCLHFQYSYNSSGDSFSFVSGFCFLRHLCKGNFLFLKHLNFGCSFQYRDELHAPLGSASGEISRRNMNNKWERRKLRKNTGRRRLDHHNQGHKQTKRDIQDDKVINVAYYIFN